MFVVVMMFVQGVIYFVLCGVSLYDVFMCFMKLVLFFLEILII